MNIVKQHVMDMKRCYCVSSLILNHQACLMFASEDPDIGCFMYLQDDYETPKPVWKAPGGCMSIVPIPGKTNEILAVQEFYLKVSASAAKIVWGTYDEATGWQFKDVLHLPFLHRFDIYQRDGVNYFIGATIADSKQNKEDWSVPGKIYVAKLPQDISEGFELEVLCKGLYRNHGYCHIREHGIDIGYFASDQGVLKITPPAHIHEKWQIEKIMDGKIGEIAVLDIDQDGENEIMTIEEFHGNQIKIYKSINGVYEVVYQYKHKIAFAHALCADSIAGVPTFLAGIRREQAELFAVQYKDGEYQTILIDQGCGPANLCVMHRANHDIIAAANHTANEAAIYIVRR